MIAFTTHIFDWLLTAMVFFGEHVIFWLLPLVLFKEFKYLCQKERLHHIWMARWGDASRAEQPVFFFFLWTMHIVISVIFSLALVNYIAEWLFISR